LSGIHEAGEGISHLHAAYLTGNLSGLEDELEGQSEKEPNGEFAGQNHEERGRGNRGRRRGNQRRHERGEQKSESNFDARGDSGAAEEGRNHQQAGDARPAIIQAATVRSRGRANGIAMGIWSTITSTATNYRSLAALGMTISYFAIDSSDKRVKVGPQADGEKHQLAQHPGKQHEDGPRHHRQTRHVGQSLILQRSQHLRDIDEQADEHRDQQQRRAHQQSHLQGVAEQRDNLFCAHTRLSGKNSASGNR